MDLLYLHELPDDAGAERAELFVEEGAEDALLEILEYPQPLLVILDEVAALRNSRIQDLQVRLAQRPDRVLLHVLRKHLSDPQRIPNQRSACQLVVESIGPVHHRTKLDDVCIEYIAANLSSNMQQNLEIPLYEKPYLSQRLY